MVNHQATDIEILVNGQARQVTPKTTAAELLQQLNVSTRGVAVEINWEVLSHDQLQRCVLQPGDAVEIVTLVGGG